MIRLLTIVIILFSCFMPDDKRDTLVWNEDRLLEWDDFRGKPAKRFSAASTHYDIFKNMEENGNAAKLSVEAVFFCNRSWKKMSWVNDEVLAHEQKHFDIVELFARKLRKAIQSRKYSSYENLKAVSDSLYDVNDKEMDIFQDKYDDETDASMNGDKQREWNKKIDTEIAKYSAWKHSSFTVSFSK
jgi:hypothetical protein